MHRILNFEFEILLARIWSLIGKKNSSDDYFQLRFDYFLIVIDDLTQVDLEIAGGLLLRWPHLVCLRRNGDTLFGWNDGKWSCLSVSGGDIHVGSASPSSCNKVAMLTCLGSICVHVTLFWLYYALWLRWWSSFVGLMLTYKLFHMTCIVGSQVGLFVLIGPL